MRLLFVTATFPFPVTNGVAMRTAGTLSALAQLGYEVHLLAFGRSEDAESAEAHAICSAVRVVTHVVKSQTMKIDYYGRLKLAISPLSYGTHLCRSAHMRDVIEQMVRDIPADAIICDTLDSMINIPEHCGIPVVLNNHNVEHLIIRRFAQRELNPLRRAYALLESRKLFRWERQACSRSQVVLACSKHDAEVLQIMCPGVRIEVVPNVVDDHAYRPSREENGYTLVYTGGMDWYPNRDAVEFFASSVLPRIRRSVPDVKFIIAGRNPSPEFLWQFESVPGMEFTGSVPDIRAHIARATVCVVPLRIGSGTRLKILEAAAMAKPIVSTHLGAEGLDFIQDEEIVLADDPEAFANAVVALLSAPERRNKVGSAARRKVEQAYSHHVLRASLTRALAKLPVNEGVAVN